MCWKDIGLCAQHLLIILDAVINRVGRDLYDHILKTQRIFTSTIRRKVAACTIWICQSSHTNCMMEIKHWRLDTHVYCMNN